MGFRKYSTVPLELIEKDKEPTWVKDADDKIDESELETDKGETE